MKANKHILAAAICAALFSSSSLADSLAVPSLDYVAILNGPSLHISPDHFNRATWGAGLGVYLSKRCFIAAGRYNNSIEHPSNYVGVSCLKEFDNGLIAEAAIGSITGYEIHPIPFLFPSIGFHVSRNSRLMVTILPPIPEVGATTINVRLEVDF